MVDALECVYLVIVVLFFDLDQIEILHSIDLIMMNRMPKTKWL
jgi:hypothetical protein